VARGWADRTDVAPDALGNHLAGAGDLAAAADAFERAGRAAAAALAFGLAAVHYRRAREAAGAAAGPRLDLALAQAEAEFASGRTLDAGSTWLEAAPSLPPAERRSAVRRAAEAFMVGGRIPDGLAALAGVRDELRLPAPRGAFRTALSVAWNLGALLIGGSEPRRGAPPDPVAIERADMCWSVGKGLAYVLPLDGLDYVLRSVRLALRAGDGPRAARGLAFLAAGVFHQVRPLQGLSVRYLAQARSEAARTGDGDLLASVGVWEGMVALGAGNWEQSRNALTEAVRRIDARPGGLHWERQVAEGLLLWLDQSAGELVDSRGRALRALTEAHERGDLYGRALFSQFVAFADVALGEGAHAREQARWIREEWAAGAFTIPSYYATMIEVLADLHDGEADAAWTRWSGIQDAFRRGGGDYAPPTVVDNTVWGARVRLNRREGGVDRAWLRSAADRLAGVPRRDGPALGSWLRAVADPAVLGDEGLARLDRVAHELEMAGLPMNAWCVRRRVAAHRGDSTEAADAWLRARGIADPDRWSACITPLPPPR